MSRQKRKPLEYIKFFWRDFNRDTAHLSRAQRDGYLQVIFAYYDNHGPLHENVIARAAGATAEEWVIERDILAKLFTVNAEGFWLCRNIDIELKRKAKMIKKRTAGRKKRHAAPRKKHGRILGDRWQKIRLSIFKRDGNLCTYCKIPSEKLHCDHILALARGGTNKDTNLTTACERCNISKSDKTLQEWGGVMT